MQIPDAAPSRTYHLDLGYAQRPHHSYYGCGDVVRSERIAPNGGLVAVLSDGLGSGPTATVLATLTTSMALGFAKKKHDPQRIGQVITRTLPADPVKGISYATFIIAEIDSNGDARLIEFDNPPVLHFHAGEPIPIHRNEHSVGSNHWGTRILRTATPLLQPDDRLILCSDGITQAGLGQPQMPFGFGTKRLAAFITRTLKRNPNIPAQTLAQTVLNQALEYDMQVAQDDMSCAVIHLREPRRLLLCTGPPFSEQSDMRLATRVKDFNGARIIAGGTTAQIISRHLGLPLSVTLGERNNDALPPTATMPTIDLITEGVITLSRVNNYLENMDLAQDISLNPGPAWAIVRALVQSDSITILVGTRINISNYDPALPIELEPRRSIVKRMADLLENKFLKRVTLEYI